MFWTGFPDFQQTSIIITSVGLYWVCALICLSLFQVFLLQIRLNSAQILFIFSQAPNFCRQVVVDKPKEKSKSKREEAYDSLTQILNTCRNYYCQIAKYVHNHNMRRRDLEHMTPELALATALVCINLRKSITDANDLVRNPTPFPNFENLFLATSHSPDRPWLSL